VPAGFPKGLPSLAWSDPSGCSPTGLFCCAVVTAGGLLLVLQATVHRLGTCMATCDTSVELGLSVKECYCSAGMFEYQANCCCKASLAVFLQRIIGQDESVASRLACQ
jgi:hypothetical protein